MDPGTNTDTATWVNSGLRTNYCTTLFMIAREGCGHDNTVNPLMESVSVPCPSSIIPSQTTSGPVCSKAPRLKAATRDYGEM